MATHPELDCPIADACGGCALIGLAYDDQLERKRAAVVEALDRFERLHGTTVDPCRPATVRHGYRNRAKLAVRHEDGQVRAGLFARGGTRLVDLAPCRVHSARVSELHGAVTRWLGRHALARPAGPVGYVDVREAEDDGWHLTLVVHAEHPPTDWPLDSLAADAPRLLGVAVNLNPHRSSYVFGPTTRTVHGRRGFEVSVEGPDGARRRFEVPATGFFQLAEEPLAEIHGAMRSHLGVGGRLLDLYCGVGLHGLTLAAIDPADDVEVVGVEEHTAAAACARRNADRHGVTARVHRGAVERLAGSLPPARRIVLNPGRPGCRPEVLEALAPHRDRRLAYLSCEPTTLARDLDRLVASGWSLRRVTPIDLLPQTDHVESLALLEA